MKRFLHDNGLSLTLFTVFVVFLLGQSIAGHNKDNQERLLHGKSPISWFRYIQSSELWEAVFENWESEFLEMAAYVFLTVFLYQKGSAESKDPEKESTSDHSTPSRRKKSFWGSVYAHSLSLAFLTLFLGAFSAHVATGTRHYNEELRAHAQPEVKWNEYLGSAQFWFESFQNWQSEFLGVSAIVLLSIWLRERNSPESKSVGSPHSKTGK